MELRFFGPPEIRDDRGEVRDPPSRKPLFLLAYLWRYRDHPHAREQLAGLFWPDADDQRARANLRHALHHLRKVLEPNEHDVGTYLQLDRISARFNPDAPCRVDVEAFEDRLDRTEQLRGDAHLEALEDAVALYRGDFLEGCYQDWCLEVREQLQARYLDALESLLKAHAARENYERAVEFAQRCLTQKPLRESIHRQLMALHCAKGDRNEALQQYERCRQALDEELDIEPSPSTQALHQMIEDGCQLDDLVASVGWSRRPLHNLPHPLSRFVGRTAEVQTIREQLASARLVSLTGLGGCGKTRLSVEVGRSVLASFADGVWFVDLAPISEAEFVSRAIAEALGVEDPQDRPIDALISHLRDRSALLILDNCEHLREACAQAAKELLTACPHLRVLATSRESLGITGEVVWPVRPLRLPEASTSAAVESADASQLFLDRARARHPGFRLNEATAARVARICHTLDGLPLALELATAQLEALTLGELERQLESRFQLLESKDPTSPPRQQTLKTTMDWGYELLAGGERVLLQRLSVFSGNPGLETIETVCSGDGLATHDVAPALTDLVETGWVTPRGDDEDRRYRLPETVRRYASDQLDATEGTAPWHDRHLAAYLELAERVEPELEGPDPVPWLDRLDTEHADLRSALRWAFDQGRFDEGVRLAGALQPFWRIRGYHRLGRRWLDRALDAIRSDQAEISASARAKVLQAAGGLAIHGGDFDRAHDLTERSLALYRTLDDADGLVRTLNNLGVIASFRGDYDEARRRLSERAAIEREQGDRLSLAGSLNNLGRIAHLQGDYSSARDHYEEGLAIARAFDAGAQKAQLLTNLALLERHHGNLDRAQAHLEEALDLARGLGERRGTANVLLDLGLIVLQQGAFARARSYFEEVRAIAEELDERSDLASALGKLGYLDRLQGRLDDAARLLDKSLALAREIGDRRGVVYNLLERGLAATDADDAERAFPYLDEALETARALGERKAEVRALVGLGLAQARSGQTERAREMGVEALELARELDDRWGEAASRRVIGRAALDAKDTDCAQTVWADALALWRELGDRRGLVRQLFDWAELAQEQGSAKIAIQLLGASVAALESMNAHPTADERRRMERIQEKHPSMPSSEWERVFREGQSFSLDDAVKLALQDLPATCATIEND